MGLLHKLFGSRTQQAMDPYLERGTILVRNVSDACLKEWQAGVPGYTPAEEAAINEHLSSFQRTADRVVGGNAVFHPEIIDTVERQFTAEALEELAGEGWKYSDKRTLPGNWKDRVSTYLKAWLCNMSPQVLLAVGEILAKAGYKGEAKQAYEVVLLFPSYAPRLFGDSPQSAELTRSIVEDAQKALREF
jgi:hypothetical protein